MLKNLKYRIIEIVNENHKRTIYRVKDIDDNTFLAKRLNKDKFPSGVSERLKNEEKILEELAGSGNIIKAFGIVESKGEDVLILEDFQGVSFKDYSLFIKSINNSGIHEINDLKEGIRIFIQVTTGIMDFHEKNIIHRSLNPDSILINPETKEIKIIDFELASRFETENIENAEILIREDELEYISPELTGKLNSRVDYRTDFYSLGIVFYEFFTGVKPFANSDIIEIIHSHIAIKPVEPINIDKDIYKTLSNIIVKLLEKLPEKRYQSAYGLICDLERCYLELQDKDTITNFHLGTKDYSTKFKVSQKIFGRDKEVKELKNVLESLRKGNSEFVMVSGSPGVGKSVLINEIRKSVIKINGFFASGKCEQFKRDISYYALMQALKKVVMQIIMESNWKLSEWSERIEAAVWPNTRIIIELMPELAKILNSPPKLAELKPAESENRFIKTLLNFISVFSTKEHPLILFIDDLQWCDQPSLKFLEHIFTEEQKGNLCIIASYRDTEVMENHLLTYFIETAENKGEVCKIHLNPLNINDTNMIVSDTLLCDSDVSMPLSRLLFSKTQGNPFFIKELLETLYYDKFLYFDKINKHWTWELSKIQGTNISENVIDFLIEKIKKLPEAVIETLKYASCLGTYFDIETIMLIQKIEKEELLKRIEETVSNGIILAMEASYDLGSNYTETDTKITFKFQHDRIQHAVYTLISECEKKEMHLKIGRLLLEKYNNSNIEDRIIEIVEHLNQGKEIVDNKEEKMLIAKFNYLAARKAKSSFVYVYAFNYITTSINLLTENSWKDDYETTYEINKFYSECAYLCGEFELAENILKKLLKRATSSLSRAEIRLAQCELYAYLGRLNDALDIGIIGLKELNINIKPNPKMYLVLKELVSVKLKLKKKFLKEIEEAKMVTDKKVTVALKLLLNFIPVAYLSGNGNLFAVTILKMMKFSLEYGNSIEAAAAYAGYTVLMAGLGDLKSAKEFGNLSLKLAKDYNDPERNGMIYVLYGLFCHSWNADWKELSNWFRKSAEEGLKSGDFLYASFACGYINLWEPGVDVGIGIDEAKKAIDIIKETKYINAMYQARLRLQKNLNLSGKTDNRHTFNISSVIIENDISIFNENECIENMIKINYMSGVANYYLYKMEVNYIYNNYNEAFSNMQECDKYISALAGSPYSVEHCFYSFLTIASLWDNLTLTQRGKWFLRLKKEYKKMYKWSQNYSENFEHKKLIMEAELARLRGKSKKVLSQFDKAINLATNKSYWDDAAIASELAAMYCKKQGFSSAATTYFRESNRLYKKWGAVEKNKQLQELYADILDLEEQESSNYSQNIIDIMDVMTIVKSAELLSSEVNFPELLRKLLRMTVENAGAEIGYIILKKDGVWLIEAELNIDENRDDVLQSIPINNSQLPLSILNYSIVKEECTVLEDAFCMGDFIDDPHIIKNKTKSVLCMPLKNQGNLNAILYLENNLITNAFTLNHIRMLDLLSSQIAISIENSRMYTDIKVYRDDLERLVDERTKELTKTLEHLKVTQNHLIESEKLAALGQLVAGVAHEINTPLGAINASISNVFNYLNDTIENKLPKLMKILTEDEQKVFFQLISAAKSDVLNITSREERNYKKKMKINLNELNIEDADNIASLMVDIGIYDEIERFLSLIKNKDYYFILQTAHDLSGIKRNSETISRSVEMATKIVFALKNYAHNDISGELVSADIIHGIETVLTIFKNKTKHSVEIVKKYEEVPKILCYPDELNQVWTNIIFNSLQAMEFKGRLEIEVAYESGNVIVKIIDNGKGISKNIIEKIFEPFFTTKSQGEGTGLGLNIVKNIITKHKGEITVESVPGKTAFTVIIPASIQTIEAK